MSGNGVPDEINEGVESGTPPDEIHDGTGFLESSFAKGDSIKSPISNREEISILFLLLFFFFFFIIYFS